MAFSRKALKARAKVRANIDRSGIAQDPYYQGDDAKHAGQPVDANPYALGTEDHNDWQQGWNEA